MNYPSFIQLPIMCDAEQGSNLNYTLYRNDGSATPNWVIFNQTSRQITGIPYSGDNGTVNYMYKATDDYNQSAYQYFSIYVDWKPIVTSPPSLQQTRTGTLFTFTIPPETITDPDGGPITYVVTSLPTWITFNLISNTISGIPSDENIGTTIMLITGTDNTGATA